jgi:hypothetical protein
MNITIERAYCDKIIALRDALSDLIPYAEQEMEYYAYNNEEKNHRIVSRKIQKAITLIEQTENIQL